MSTICFTGHRPDKLGGFEHSNPLNMMIESKLGEVIEDKILNGHYIFLSGGAFGVDQMAARQVINMKSKYSNVILIIACPFPSQVSKWSAESQKYFKELCDQADKVIDVCDDQYAPEKN